jgi:hypothetical protein
MAGHVHQGTHGLLKLHKGEMEGGAWRGIRTHLVFRNTYVIHSKIKIIITRTIPLLFRNTKRGAARGHPVNGRDIRFGG